MPNPQPGQMGDWRCINCKRIVLNNVEPESCWDCKGKLFARIVPASGRPTPDGEIGELVARLAVEWENNATHVREIDAAPDYQHYWRGYAKALESCAQVLRARAALATRTNVR